MSGYMPRGDICWWADVAEPAKSTFLHTLVPGILELVYSTYFHVEMARTEILLRKWYM